MHSLYTERSTERLTAHALALALLASTTLLSGCAIWPKALTFHSDPVEAQEAPVAAEPMPAPVAAMEPKTEAPISVVAEAPKVEPAKLERPVPLPAMRLPEPIAEIRSGGANGPGRGIYINVGLFAVPFNGVNAYQKLDQAGMPVFLDSVQSKAKGTLSRVRVGPFASRSDAQAAAKKIHALKLDAVVIQL